LQFALTDIPVYGVVHSALKSCSEAIDVLGKDVINVWLVGVLKGILLGLPLDTVMRLVLVPCENRVDEWDAEAECVVS
jgi:hypothetical protein